MVYPNLKFPKKSRRPFFYTNFVSTLDGQVAVKKPGYWPIGSKKDHQVLTELRAYADCLLVGGNLGRQFGAQTLSRLGKNSFKKLRKKLGKDPVLPFYIISSSTPTNQLLKDHLIRPKGRDLQNLVEFLQKKGYQNALVEGGPILLTSFLKEGLIDQVFLTVAPKIFGSLDGFTSNLVTGYLFPAQKTINLQLLSVKQQKSELFLRYQIIS